MTAPAQPLDVFIVAGEESGDQLGAHLMDALKVQHEGPVAFRGVGGPRMERRDFVSRFPMTEIALFGITSIIVHIPNILRRVRETVAEIVARPPDVLVLVDCPGFNRRVARAVRKARPEIPIVFYVSPTVWAWRPARAAEMRPFVDHLLALLPFEPEVHRRLGGPPTTFVGHPISERLAELRPGPEDAMRARQALLRCWCCPAAGVVRSRASRGSFRRCWSASRRGLARRLGAAGRAASPRAYC